MVPKVACHPKTWSFHLRTSFWAGHSDLRGTPCNMSYRLMRMLWRRWKWTSHSQTLIVEFIGNFGKAALKEKLKNRNNHGSIYWKTSQPRITIWNSLPPNSTTTSSLTNTTNYDITRLEFLSSQALERKQSKYNNMIDQCHDQLYP